MFWAEPTPFDIVFVALPSLLLAYLAYHTWRDNRERIEKEGKDAAALEAAFNDWVVDPSIENENKMDEAIKGARQWT